MVYTCNRGFPCGASVKEPPCQCKRHKRYGFDPWVREIPWRRAWQPTPVFLPGESPWTAEPGCLQSKGSQRVGHDWSDLACTYIYNGLLFNLKKEGNFIYTTTWIKQLIIKGVANTFFWINCQCESKREKVKKKKKKKNLKVGTLSKLRWSQKYKNNTWFHLYEALRLTKFIERESRMMLTRSRGEGGSVEFLFDRYRVSIF